LLFERQQPELKAMKTRRITTLAALLLTSGAAFAQSGGPYSLTWSTLDGGGGASAGGGLTLNGTIGQPDAGAPMSGGGFTLTGGFWSGVATVSPAPRLSIRLGTGHTVILSWPNPSAGYVLQQTSNMNALGGGWTDVGPQPTIVGPNKEVTLQAVGSFCLFRLRHP
jgi:hypothetical protein